MQQNDSTPSDNKEPHRSQRARQRIKERLKLTWIGWLCICARRTKVGTILLTVLLFALLFGADALFSYVCLRQHGSWDQLPCEAGILSDVSRPRRGMASGTLLNGLGVEYRFYGGAFGNIRPEELKALRGQSIKVCYTHHIRMAPPFHYRYAEFLFHPPDGRHALWMPERKFEEEIQFVWWWARLFLFWIALPALLWLLKRHGHESLKEWKSHLEYPSN